jgi:hypothetical protein
LVGSVVLLVLGLVMGAVAIWDVRGLASSMRGRLEERSVIGAAYKRMPSWTFRAFGVWCVVFGVGQFAIVYIVTRRLPFARTTNWSVAEKIVIVSFLS